MRAVKKANSGVLWLAGEILFLTKMFKPFHAERGATPTKKLSLTYLMVGRGSWWLAIGRGKAEGADREREQWPAICGEDVGFALAPVGSWLETHRQRHCTHSTSAVPWAVRPRQARSSRIGNQADICTKKRGALKIRLEVKIMFS